MKSVQKKIVGLLKVLAMIVAGVLMPQSQLHTGDTAKNSQNRLIFSGFYTYFFGVFR